MFFSDLRTGIELLRRLYDRSIDPVCARHEVTRMELDVLLFLANNPEQDTASDLVELRRLSKSRVSAAVSDLTERGLLDRVYRDGNRKTAHLVPLPAAEELIVDGRAAQQAFFSILSAGVSPAEIEALGAVTGRVLSNLKNAMH